MASTEVERGADGAIRPLTLDDLAGALRLSASANWNQNEADWRGMLARGQGWGVQATTGDGAECLAASTVVLPYGERFAWISMVLVMPEFRRRGYASRLLRHALAWLSARGLAAVLDATPAGHGVYAQQGFADSWTLARYRREASNPTPVAPSAIATRALREEDWPALIALDEPAFGADRSALLRSLAGRWPAAARVAEADGALRGFVLGRDGREAHQIGPLLALDDATATSLLADALSAADGAVYLDLFDSRGALLPWLRQQGFALQRPFTRMVLGTATAPGNPLALVLAAGPELG